MIPRNEHSTLMQQRQKEAIHAITVSYPGKTCAEMAHEIGVVKSTIWKLLHSNRNPSSETVGKILKWAKKKGVC